MDKQTLTREELYNLVWSQPLSSIAKKNNTTSDRIKKICKEANIPLPKMGYWQKIKYGKSVREIKLPTDYSGKNEFSIINEENTLKKKELNELQKRIDKIKKTKGLPLKVPVKLINPDKLIVLASKEINERLKSSSYKNRSVHSGFNNIYIDVSPKNVNRALRIMDTLIKLFKSRNHSIEIGGRETAVYIYGQKTTIKLNEKLKRVKQENDWHTFVPTGILTFRYGESYRIKVISDGEIKLEKQMAKILALLEHKSEADKIRKKEIAEYWEIQRLKEQKENEIRKRKEKEIDNFKQLFKMAQRRDQANFIREYIKTFETQAKLNGTSNKELEDWFLWAKKKADWYDPIINAEDDLLEGITPDQVFESINK